MESCRVRRALTQAWAVGPLRHHDPQPLAPASCTIGIVIG